jgi:protein SDA1
MKQLVDGFISDRTRPEAMAVGLKTVRELAARSPLLMTPDLLQVRRQPL